MPRIKSAPRKKSAPEVKQAGKNSTEQFSAEKKFDSEKSNQSKTRSDKYGYDNLAKQTLDLWRDQLGHFLNNPDAFAGFTGNDLKKNIEPSAALLSPQIAQMFSPLFAGGMDLWLMMLEQLGKAANMNIKGSTDAQDEQKTASQSKARHASQGGAASFATVSGAGTTTMAELTSRIAELEKRFSEFERGKKKSIGKKMARKSARKTKSVAPPVAEIKPAGQKRGSAI